MNLLRTVQSTVAVFFLLGVMASADLAPLPGPIPTPSSPADAVIPALIMCLVVGSTSLVALWGLRWVKTKVGGNRQPADKAQNIEAKNGP
ncbi:MAG: hypothetical protein V1875_09055 [Candidatus Altiarchaeota archaeon]